MAARADDDRIGDMNDWRRAARRRTGSIVACVVVGWAMVATMLWAARRLLALI